MPSTIIEQAQIFIWNNARLLERQLFSCVVLFLEHVPDRERDHKKGTHIACRFTHPQELEALLYYNGFQVIQQSGSWENEALSASSPGIITICKVR